MASTVIKPPRATALDTPSGMRRAFTLPTRLTESPSAGSSIRRDADGIEILFSHGSGKIVAFSPNTSTSRPNSSSSYSSREQDDAVGTLPWASPTERTIAVGPLRIYSVPGSVAFLNSGMTLHPILAKSQCWCVDGETKFVLRIRTGSYYRIELPNNGDEDRKVAGGLKQVLSKVLQYETTPCPFSRDFTVELPEPPKTPIRKRPWRPLERPKIERTGDLESSDDTDEYLTAPSDNSSRSGTEDEGDGHGENENMVTSRVARPRGTDMFMTTTRLKGPATMARSITAPAQTYPSNSPASEQSPSAVDHIFLNNTDTSSLSSSVDSFQSFYSTKSPLPPSPPDSNPPSPPPYSYGTTQALDIPRRRQHKRDVSDITITPGPPGRSTNTADLEHSPISLPPTTPTLIEDVGEKVDEDWSPVETLPQSSELRHRRPTTPRQRSLSPLPSPANIFSPSPRRSGHRLAIEMVQRSCAIIAGPLITLMIRIASRIANGAIKGVAFGYGDKGERIPCQWDYSEEDGDANLDDYGVPLQAIPASSANVAEIGGSWEVD